MLRVHCVQLFYNLSDPGMEDLLYESDPVRRFVGLKLTGPLPDETTILNFRHLLERHNLGQGLLEEINTHLESQGLKLREGTIVDATIIEAPSSTKNRAGERDPEMHQTKKGNQWHFGMKAHIGVDSETGIVHSMTHDGGQQLTTSRRRTTCCTVVRGWCGATPGTRVFTSGKRPRGWRWSGRWPCGRGGGGCWTPGARRRLAEKAKASVRAKVEHPFQRVKGLFGYVKVRYRGLMKNTQRLALLFGMGNLLTAESQLVQLRG